MISSGQILLNRWRVDGDLNGTQQIKRFFVWDLETHSEWLLITPAATELLDPKQPAHFLSHHQQQAAKEVSLHQATPYAIYPLHSGELKDKTTYPDDTWLQLLHVAKSDPSPFPLDYPEIIQQDKSIKICRLGHVHQNQRIGVNPLHHPNAQHHATFSIAMMCILQQSPTLRWNTRTDFQQWLDEQHFTSHISAFSAPLQAALSGCLTGGPWSSEKHSSPITLSPLQQYKQLPATSGGGTSTTTSSALRVKAIPQYLLVVNSIQAKRVARDLALVLEVSESSILEQMSEPGPIILGGADTMLDAQNLVELCDNIPITIDIIHKHGSFSTWLLFGSSAITTGMGVGVMLLTGSLAGLIVPATTIPMLGWLRSNWMSSVKRKWKGLFKVGVAPSQLNLALNSARRRVLLSELPPSAIEELMKTIDDLAISGRVESDIIQIAHSVCTTDVPTALSTKAIISKAEQNALDSVQ